MMKFSIQKPLSTLKCNSFSAVIIVLTFILGIVPSSAFKVHELKTSSGIPFWFHQDTSVDIVSLAFNLEHSGSAYLDGDLPGLLKTYAAMLTEGTASDDALSYRRKIAQNAIRLSFDSDSTSFKGSLSTSTKTLMIAKKLFKDALYEASFDQERLDLLTTRLLTSLKDIVKKPQYLLNRMTAQGIYGNHAYAKMTHLTQKSAAQISPDVLKKLRQNLYNRQDLHITLSGNLSKEQAIELIEDLFEKIPDQHGRDAMTNVTINLNGQVNAQASPYPQSLVNFFAPGIGPDHPDYMPFLIALDIFGGGLESRIGTSVRENSGLVYAIAAGPSSMDGVALVTGHFDSTDQNVSKAIDLVKAEFKKFVTKGITEDELKDTKTKFIGSYVVGLSSTSSIAQRLLFLKINHFPSNYIDRRADIINEISTNKVNTLLKTLFAEKRLTFFVFGNPAI